MKNKMTDLNNYLFEQIERVNDDSLTPEQFEMAIKRAESIGKLSTNIMQNNRLQLDAIKFAAEYGIEFSMPEILLGATGQPKQIGGK